MASILIVEGDEELRPLFRAALAEAGHHVHEAGTRAAAREVIARTRVDLAVVDGMLPEGDGLLVVRELRALANPAKVIFLGSAWHALAGGQSLEALGVERQLRKPLGPAELLAAVDAELGLSSRPDEAESAAARVRAHWAERTAAYAASLNAKLSELRAALLTARTAGPGTPEFRDALTRAHRLHGTSGTFGFQDVSELGGSIEQTLQRIEAGTDSSGWATIEEALNGSSVSPLQKPRPSLSSSLPKSLGASILVIDDDPDFLDGVTQAGMAASLEVYTAKDEQSALELTRTQPVDVVLVDMMLSEGKKGADILSELRQLDTFKTIAFAAISADSSVKNRLAAMHAGADLFLAKPIDGDELAACVRRIVDRKEREAFRVLIVDDDPIFATSIARVLRRQGWETSTLSSIDTLFEALGDVRPDLMLLDVMMPVSGFDVCRVVRSSPIWQDLPIVFLTGATDHETLVACYSVGGDDYVKKPILENELVARVRLRLERMRSLRQRAFEDGLTGLLTRAAFADVVTQRLSEAARRERPLSIALLDLDHFKHINDTYGHLAGDRVLRGLGRLLKQQFRTEDVRARWGGEEFAVACYEEDALATSRGIERALGEFRSLVFRADGGELFSATFSAGIACFPVDGGTLDALIQRADSRLYAAKRAGRNRVVTRTQRG